MLSSLTIRPVVREDFEQWFRLWENYNQFYGRSGVTALPMQITKTTWSRFFDPSEPVHALVAENNLQLVGFTHYIFHRSTIMLEPACYLQDLFIEAQSRGHRLGEALIDAVYEQAKTAGSTRVYWQTQESNLTAMRLYDRVAERSGFIVYRKQF